MPVLIVEIENVVKTFELPEGMPVFIGRHPVCEIQLPSAKVSRKHTVVIFKDGICGIKDLSSHNGTVLNSTPLAKPTKLKNNDRISIGPYQLLFRDSGRPVSARRSARMRSHDTHEIHDSRTKSRSHRLRPHRDTVVSTSMRRMMEEAESETDKSALNGDDTQDFNNPDFAAAVRDAAPAGPLRKPEQTTRKIAPPAPPPSRTEAGYRGPSVEEEFAASFKAHTMKAAAEEVDANENCADEDVDEDVDDAGEGGAEASGVEVSDDELYEPGDDESAAARRLDDIPLSEDLRKAIELRLQLYPQLARLASERKKYRAKNPGLAKNVVAELGRQDQEMNAIPTLDQAESLLTARRGSWQGHFDENGEPNASAADTAVGLSIEMFAAEKIALQQWELLIDSGRRHLPEICRLGYRVMAPEPLARELDEARIQHSILLGGAAYCLALEVLRNEVEREIGEIRERVERIREGGGETGTPFYAKLARKVSLLLNLNSKDKTLLDALGAKERQLAARSGWIQREHVVTEKAMVKEFWKVYSDVACHYIAGKRKLPPAVRAFLRFGVVGFKPWWMSAEVKALIEASCANNVVGSLNAGSAALNVVYADEYLGSVMRAECTALYSMQAEASGGDAARAKTDRLVRRLINSRERRRQMNELLEDMKERIAGVDSECTRIDISIMEAVAESSVRTKGASRLHGDREALTERKKDLTAKHNQLKTLAKEIGEVYAESESAFREPRMKMPPDTLVVRRECETLAGICAYLSGRRERFVPLVIRNESVYSAGHANPRETVRESLAEVELLDPGLFSVPLVPGKKKRHRVELRCCPVTVIVPSYGARGYACHPREGMESGRLAFPTFYSRANVQKKQLVDVLADYRWDTSTMVSGRDVMASDTLAGAFARLRWDWREMAKEKRERGLIFNEQNDRRNWRRVYDTHLQDLAQGGKRLSTLNPDCYALVIEKYMDLPDDVESSA